VKPVIMLVDDEPGILSALTRTLRREGYEILLMENARSALATLEVRAVDVIVSDQKMPGMTGIAFLERVACHWPATRRILLSGWSSEIAAEKLAAARLDAVLTKPWEDEVLKQAIRVAVDARSTNAAPVP
jgi:CheY-like chemotaxis protein